MGDVFPKSLEFKILPPYYNIEKLSLIICNRGFVFWLYNHKISQRLIEGHTGDCESVNYPALDELTNIFIARLKQRGIDTALLENKNFSLESLEN